jgi:hypothetical protein
MKTSYGLVFIYYFCFTIAFDGATAREKGKILNPEIFLSVATGKTHWRSRP